MIFLELFSGSGVFSETARRMGHQAITVDINPEFKPDLVCDLSGKGHPPEHSGQICCCLGFSALHLLVRGEHRALLEGGKTS